MSSATVTYSAHRRSSAADYRQPANYNNDDDGIDHVYILGVICSLICRPYLELAIACLGKELGLQEHDHFMNLPLMPVARLSQVCIF